MPTPTQQLQAMSEVQKRRAQLKQKYGLYKKLGDQQFYTCSEDLLPGGGPKNVFGPFSSLKIIWTKKIKKFHEIHERPPYPVIISDPTLSDIFNNLKLPDYIFFLTFYFGGTIPAYIASAKLGSLKARLYTYHLTALSFTLLGFAGMCESSDQRLKGFWENGLRWKYPERRMEKYDYMSDYIKTSRWRYFVQQV